MRTLSAFTLTLLALSAQAAGTGGNSYTVANLAADTSGTAPNVDALLINPFGLSRPPETWIPDADWWAANNATGTSTLYNASGAVIPLTVTVPPASGTSTGSPTGTVDFNNNFVFVTLDGTISVWYSDKLKKTAAIPASMFNPAVHAKSARVCSDCHVTTAEIVVNNAKASYSGATLVWQGFKQVLLVANSNSPTIEAYDSSFKPVTLAAGAFTDPKIPSGFTPNNIQTAGGVVWVAYSNSTPTGGYVDGYGPNGKLLVRLQSGNWINDPWGIALAPSNFGKFSNALLVGSTEAGTISAFNRLTGAHLGNLQDGKGHDLNLSGLWALSFGTGNPYNGPANVLYFTTGTANFLHGIFGSISAN
ncbi:MAG: TIGR03118 family protein [Nevskia sp.]|nr:TIGR03118 family protein [Nevskia sp.]